MQQTGLAASGPERMHSRASRKKNSEKGRRRDGEGTRPTENDTRQRREEANNRRKKHRRREETAQPHTEIKRGRRTRHRLCKGSSLAVLWASGRHPSPPSRTAPWGTDYIRRVAPNTTASTGHFVASAELCVPSRCDLQFPLRRRPSGIPPSDSRLGLRRDD